MTLIPSIMLAAVVESAPPAQEPETTIVIRGPRRESTHPQRAGQSVSIRPLDESQFDTKAQFKQQATLSVPDTGRTNASGFALPRIRGQDARLTEVYLDGMRIQDPYLGYPFLDDLDLRACGQMDIYSGNSPPAVPSLSPNGAIVYRMYQARTSVDQLGVVVGRPFGTALWGIKQGRFGTDGAVRLYGREHWTRGHYSYYDDNATPYNKNDDHLREKSHADRRSVQLLPSAELKKDGHRLAALGLWNQAQTSLPALSSQEPSAARELARNSMARATYTYSFVADFALVPRSIGLELGRFDDNIEVFDPSQRVIGSAEVSARRLKSTTNALNVAWAIPGIESDSWLYLRGEAADTDIVAKTSAANSFRVQRQQNTFYTGADLALKANIGAEIKASRTLQQDHIAEAQNESSLKSFRPSRHMETQGTSAALRYHLKQWTVYAQVGRVERAPSLLEEYGDGAFIRESPELRAEATEHHELGLHSPSGPFAGRLAVFRDRTRDRVILAPAAAQTLRAQNAAHTEIEGVETGLELTMAQANLALAYAFLKPIDRSIPGRIRQIPGVAAEVATSSLSYSVKGSTIRLASRFQSQLWRDSENSIAVPGYMIHDLTLDTKWQEYALGVGIYNLGNQQRLAIQGGGSQASQGYTSYSDYAGMPLPGRHWRLSLSAAL